MRMLRHQPFYTCCKLYYFFNTWCINIYVCVCVYYYKGDYKPMYKVKLQNKCNYVQVILFWQFLNFK